MLNRDLFGFIHSFNRFNLNIICHGMPHFLMLSIGNQKMHLVAHGYKQMLIKMVYLTYVQNDIKIAVLFEQ